MINIFNLLIIVIALNRGNPGNTTLFDPEALPVPDQQFYCIVPQEYIMDASDDILWRPPADIKGTYSFFTRLKQRLQPERVEITDYGAINADQV